MRQDGPLVKRNQFHHTNEAAARVLVAGRRGELFRVGVEAGFAITSQHIFCQPFVKVLPCPGIHVVLWCIIRELLAFVESHHIVLRQIVVGRLKIALYSVIR